jgi:hypothetical protein
VNMLENLTDYEPINPRLRIILISFGLLTILGIGIWLSPYAFSLYYLTRGGQILESVSPSDVTLDIGVTCEEGDISTREKVGNAIWQLKKAIQYDPNDAQSHLLLGRAYCLDAEPGKAIEAYLVYTQLRPANPLGHMELGFAFEKLCQKNMEELYEASRLDSLALNLGCYDNDIKALVASEWKKAEITPSFFIEQANQAFARQEYERTNKLFQYNANLSADLPPKEAIRWAIAGLKMGERNPVVAPSLRELVYPFRDNGVRVEAENLLWAREDNDEIPQLGDRLVEYPSGSDSVGTMWWNGSAIAFLDIPTDGDYIIALRIQNTPPLPVEIQIEHNFIPILAVNTTREDFSWEYVRVKRFMSSGTNVIGVRFVNDDNVNGNDRNAVLDWIEIRKD